MEAMNKAKKTMMRVGWGLSFTLVSAAQAACVPLTGTDVAGGLGEAAKTALVRWLGEARLPLAMCLSCLCRSSCGRCWRYPPACSARATSRELALLLLLLPLLLWHCRSGHWWPLCCFQCRLVLISARVDALVLPPTLILLCSFPPANAGSGSCWRSRGA